MNPADLYAHLSAQLDATLLEIGRLETNHKLQMKPRYDRAEHLARELSVLPMTAQAQPAPQANGENDERA